MSRLPALQFYPGDWFRDAAVQSLTTLERGIWFELLLLMHDSPCRGKLLISTQKVYPKTSLSRRFGMRPKRLDTILDKFVSYGVADRCEDTGALMCRRMVRETEQNLHMQKVRKAAANKRWNRCKPDANPMQNRCKPDAKPMQTRCKPDAKAMQKRCKSDTNTETLDNQEVPEMTVRRTLQNRGAVAAVAKKKKVPSSPLDGFPPDPSSLIPLLSPKKKKVPPEAPPKGGAGRALTVAQKRRTRQTENTPLMVTIGSWFRRKPTTKWTLYEAEALEQVSPSESEIKLMGKYYTASMSPQDNIRRRDVGTLLNNWAGELDRAGSFNSGTFFRDNGRANSEVLKELRERLKEAKKDIDGITQDGRYLPTEEDEWLRLKELRKDRRELKQQIDKIMDAFK